MIYDFNNLRPYPPKYPTYPPYANIEEYMEHYFYNYYKNNLEKFQKIDRQYLPVFWTTLYNDNTPINVTEYLSSLPKDKKYFTVNQHDNGILFPLPDDTLVFSASENGGGKIITIPLLASPIQKTEINLEKDILCSFIGTITHPIRTRLYQLYNHNKDFYFTQYRNWSPVIDDNQLSEFYNITKRSKFSLCPRGNIIQSFRIYEVMQLNSVPVIVSNSFTYPFKEFINWEEFSIIINDQDIHNIESILKSITDDRYDILLKRGQEIYKQYFTLEKMCENIFNILHNS